MNTHSNAPSALIIDDLVGGGYYLQSWRDRYGNGIWVCLAPGEDLIDEFRDLTSAGDNDALPTAEYIHSADWLPLVAGKTLSEAMAKLESRLSELPKSVLKIDSYWALAVMDALQHVSEVSRKTPNYGLEGRYAALPKSFTDIDPTRRLDLEPR